MMLMKSRVAIVCYIFLLSFVMSSLLESLPNLPFINENQLDKRDDPDPDPVSNCKRIKMVILFQVIVLNVLIIKITQNLINAALMIKQSYRML